MESRVASFFHEWNGWKNVQRGFLVPFWGNECDFLQRSRENGWYLRKLWPFLGPFLSMAFMINMLIFKISSFGSTFSQHFLFSKIQICFEKSQFSLVNYYSLYTMISTKAVLTFKEWMLSLYKTSYQKIFLANFLTLFYFCKF